MKGEIHGSDGRRLVVEQLGDQVALVFTAPARGNLKPACAAMLIDHALALRLAELITGAATVAEEHAHASAERTSVVRAWAGSGKPVSALGSAS
jgi:hypothetical protein